MRDPSLERPAAPRPALSPAPDLRPRRAKRARLLLLSGLLLGATQAPAAQDEPAATTAPDVATVLEKLRASLGRAGPVAHGYVCRGQATYLGLSGPFYFSFDGNGRQRFEVDTDLPLAFAHDGEQVWKRDLRGMAHVVELEERDRWRLLPWILTGYWLDPRAPVEVRLAKTPAGAGSIALEVWLQGTPLTMRVEIDERTWTPSSAALEQESGASTWELSAWNRVEEGQAWKVPFSIVEKEADLLQNTFRVERSTRQEVPEAYALKVEAPADCTYDKEADPALTVERVFSGHLLVHPQVEGQDVGWFILDTGAGAMCIDEKVAERLGLEPIGEVLAVGAGGRRRSSFRRGTSFELGPWTLSRPLYVDLDLSFLGPIFGRDVAGIVGFDLFARAVVEIEPARPFVAIHDPARYGLAEEHWQRLVLDDNLPCVEARFEGDRRGLFKLDTGANGTVSFHRPAVERYELLEGRAVTPALSGGVGGAVVTKVGTLEWFELAGHRFERPQASFSEAEVGAFTDRYTLGNIGQEFLQPFRLVLDYARRRIAFLPAEASGSGD